MIRELKEENLRLQQQIGGGGHSSGSVRDGYGKGDGIRSGGVGSTEETVGRKSEGNGKSAEDLGAEIGRRGGQGNGKYSIQII